MITREEAYRTLVRGTTDRALQSMTPGELAVRESIRQQLSGAFTGVGDATDEDTFRFGVSPGFGRKFA